ALQTDRLHDDGPGDVELLLAVLLAEAVLLLHLPARAVLAEAVDELALLVVGEVGLVERVEGRLAAGVFGMPLSEGVRDAAGDEEGGRVGLEDQAESVRLDRLADGRREGLAGVLAGGLAQREDGPRPLQGLLLDLARLVADDKPGRTPQADAQEHKYRHREL